MPKNTPDIPNDNFTDVLRLERLSIGYASRKGDVVVARGLDACLRRGELVCLLGPNGAGKSTLLRTLAGFQPPLAGSVSVMGKPLSYYKPQERAQTIGVVLTEKPDVQNMSALEMAMMGRSPYTGFFGRCSAADRLLALKALRMVGVEALAARRYSTLSDGERQKVMIAKALCQQTPLVLLDEPSAFLDFPSKADLMAVMRRVCHEMGRAVLLSTHDVPQALEASDRVWLMGQGGKFACGTPQSLADDGTLAAFFPTLPSFTSFTTLFRR